MRSSHQDSKANMTDQVTDNQEDCTLENPFWQFSLSLYAKPEVTEYCLTLQDKHNMQVNLLLYSIWLSTKGCILEPLRIKQNSQLQNWLTQVIPSIREARIQVGENSKQDPLYKQLKACELKAEQRAQAILFSLKRKTSEQIDTSLPIEFNNLLTQNLDTCWHAFSPINEKNTPPALINEFSKWMIVHCQRKIVDKFNH